VSDPLPLDALRALRVRPRRLLAVLPHPDDESYGLGGTLARYGEDPEAAAVLLTLTRGEAARAGLDAGMSPAEQAALRTDRMRRVAEILRLDVLVLRDFPDRGLSLIDPRPIEAEVSAVLEAFRPQVLVSFGPRGVNAHPDHIATHHVVKRAVLEARDLDPEAVPRLAMLTVPAGVAESIPRLLFGTPDDEIDLVLDVAPWAEAKEACLRLHEAYLTVTGDGSDGRIARPPVETLRIWGDAPERRPLTEIFEDLKIPFGP
jgi:LmbE family N-acetylglucosaminyl deacetylase